MMRFSDSNKPKYNEIKKNISMKNLEVLMKSRNISDTKLGNELYLSDSSIQGYRYNTKHPSLVSLIKLADYFDVNIDFLLDRTDIPTKVDDLIEYDSDDFNSLVRMYNQLSKEDKASVIGYINGLIKSSKNNP